MMNNIIIAGSLLMFVCVMVTSIEYSNMVPETLENYICMVSFYIIISSSHLIFICVIVTSIEYSNIVQETLDNYIYYIVSCYSIY